MHPKFHALKLYDLFEMCIRDSHYSLEALEKARHQHELVQEGNTYLYLDARQCGVGGDMPGMACLREPYILHGSMPYSFRFTISPLNTK